MIITITRDADTVSQSLYLLHDVAQVDVLHSGDIHWLDAGDTKPHLLIPAMDRHHHAC